MTDTRVLSESSGGVMTLSLARTGRGNALDAGTVAELTRAIDDAERTSARAVVLRAVGPIFCGGFDLEDVADSTSADLAWRFLAIGRLLERLQTAPFLTVAVVDGPAIGAGADLVAACDVRLATERAEFRFPGSAFGVVLGTRRLAGLVGEGTAVAWAATGARIGPEAAERRGLVGRVDVLDALDREVDACTRSAARRTGSTLAALKATTGGPDPAGMADLARSLVAHPDLAVEIAQFAQKARKPTGKDNA